MTATETAAPRFDRIVVGLDGRGGGDDATALARTLAAPGADIVLVHVRPRVGRRGIPAPAGDAPAGPPDPVLAAAARPGVRTLTVAGLGVARALHAVAEAEDADLLVVGATHRGPAGRALLGDHVRGLLHRAECPVAVAPPRYRDRPPGPLTRIGVAYAHGPEAEAALALGERLAARDGASLRVRTVVDTPLPFNGYGIAYAVSPFTDARHRRAERELNARVGGIGVPATADVIDGPIAWELEGLAYDVDLLVAGSHRRGPALRLLLGSTSDRLSHELPCPLLVVPREAAARAGAALAAAGAPAPPA